MIEGRILLQVKDSKSQTSTSSWIAAKTGTKSSLEFLRNQQLRETAVGTNRSHKKRETSESRHKYTRQGSIDEVSTVSIELARGKTFRE